MTQRQRHVVSLECSSNPCTVKFDEPFRNVTNVEVRKSYFTRSERTVEQYRNVPFLLLVSDWVSKIDFEDPDSESRRDFVRLTGVDPWKLKKRIEENDNDQRFLNLGKLNKSYDFVEGNSQSIRCRELGIVPFVLPFGRVNSATDIQNELNRISAQNIYNGLTNLYLYTEFKGYFFNMICSSPYVLIPGNACELVGLRDDGIYVSYYYYWWQGYIVDGEPPKIGGTDVLTLTCEELSGPMTFSNNGYPLYTAYLNSPLVETQLSSGSKTFLPKVNTLQNNEVGAIERDMNEITKLAKLTLSLSIDPKQRIFYELNGAKWYVEITVTCRSDSKISRSLTETRQMRHIVPLKLFSNNETVTFDDSFRNVVSIEILRSYLTRSEMMVEPYRNVPFIALRRDWFDRFDMDDPSDPANINFERKTGLKARSVYSMMQDAFKYWPDQTFIPTESGENIDVFHDFPNVQWGDNEEYIEEEIKNGMMPYIIGLGKYGVTSLEHAFFILKMLNDNRYYPYNDIKMKIFEERVIIETKSPCVIIPSNAAGLFGLRTDGIYVPGIKWSEGKLVYYIQGDLTPKVDGPDVVYIRSPDIKFMDEINSEKAFLSTVFLKSNENSSSSYSSKLQSTIQINDQQLVERPLNSMIPRLSKISFQVYSDQKKKHPYLFNGNPWYLELLIVTEP